MLKQTQENFDSNSLNLMLPDFTFIIIAHFNLTLHIYFSPDFICW